MPVFKLTDTDNGRTLVASVEDSVEIYLSENPTTAYRWQEDATPQFMEKVFDEFSTTSTTRPGSGGTRVIQFRITSTGTGELSLKLWREWEGNKSVTQRFMLTVQVQT